MAQSKKPRFDKKSSAFDKRQNIYTAAVHEIFKVCNKEAASLALSTGYDGSKPFSFKNFPATKKKIQQLQGTLALNMRSLVINGTTVEFENSNLVIDKMVQSIFKQYGKTGDIHKFRKHVPQFFEHNNKALATFQQRTQNGMNLSQRCWILSEEYKSGLEAAVSVGIEKGTSAITLSKQISKYLVDFPELKKNYTAKFGKANNVVDCEYRAVRLARTEINMAYRTAEQNRWKQLDFVVGYEVKRSATEYDCPVCDALRGKYPTSFKFVGWHPNCRCYTVPILKTPEEMRADTQKILSGKKTNDDSVNKITDVPQNFKDWVMLNEDRINAAKDKGTLPYFVRDNEKYFPQMRITDAAAKGVKEAQVFSEKLAMQARANVYGNAEVKISEKVLYRGDIRDKGDVFHDTDDVMDYKRGGEAKNKAGFHFFTDSKEYARDYATEQMNQMRGEIQTNILTTVKTDKGLYILDLDKMSLKEQMEFHRSLFDYGINNMQYKQDLICQYKGDFTQKSIDKFFGYSTNGKILNSGQMYSDGDTGVLFKQWLRDNGFDGYAFTMFKDKEYALLNKDMFSVVERKNLSKL